MPLPTFTLNDETKKNSHGFYLLNSGGNLERFLDNPVMLDNHDMDRLIGRWANPRVEGSLLVADPDFDEGTDLGAERKGQVERGYLKGASPGIVILAAEWRSNPATGEEALYVTEWELFEGSTTPVPSNAGAITLRIYGADRQPIADKDIRLHIENIVKLSAESKEPGTIKITDHMEKITLTAEALVALGIPESADSTAVSAAIMKLRSDLKTKDERVTALETAARTQAEKAATDMVELAVKEGRITADKKAEWVALAMEKPDMAKAALAAIPAKESLSKKIETLTVGDIPEDRKGWTALAWMKKDPQGWTKLCAENPTLAEQIKAKVAE